MDFDSESVFTVSDVRTITPDADGPRDHDHDEEEEEAAEKPSGEQASGARDTSMTSVVRAILSCAFPRAANARSIVLGRDRFSRQLSARKPDRYIVGFI